MKKILFLYCILLTGSTALFAQNKTVINTIAVFPYQHKADADADAAVISMQAWKQSSWNSLLSMLDDDSLKLKASYALSACVNESSMNSKNKAKIAARLSKGLSVIHSYYANELVIKYLGRLREDVAVKPLEQLLSDKTLVDNAARALATINTEKSKAALQKAMTVASGTDLQHIKVALDHMNAKLPQINETKKHTITGLNNEEKNDGFTMLFNGADIDEWTGNTEGYLVENGQIVVHPEKKGGNLYTKDEFADFIFRFEFQLTPGANNGIGIRAPLTGDAAYVGMEIQVLDSEADKYKNLQPYQYHGSVYGVIPAKRGFLKPVGEWNQEEIYAKGNHIKVTLNGTVIVDGDIKEAAKNGTMDHKEHPGLFNPSGHIGFLGHGDVVRFKNIRIKKL